MTGIEKITKQILEDANACAKEITDKAEAEAKQIIANAQADATRIKEQSVEKLAIDKVSTDARAKSSSDLKMRQAILKAKQEIINGVIDKAYNQILNMSDDKYFALIEKSLAKSAQSLDGEIYFNEKDLARLTKEMESKISDIAAAKGGSLKVAKEAKDIDGGFILAYGGIEENCSIKAIFNAEKERMADKVNTCLFA